MKIGLIGLPETGKTTIFELLTGSGAGGRTQANIGTAKVPDCRIDRLAEIYRPRKVTYAAIEVTDIKGIVSGSSSRHFLESVRQADSLVHVIRSFRNDDIPHIEGSTDPFRDICMIDTELIFADLSTVESRLDKIMSNKKTKVGPGETGFLQKCRESLEKETFISRMEFNEDEVQYLRSYNFLTDKPLILLVNLDEEQFRSGKYAGKDEIVRYAENKIIHLLEICAKTELDIAGLDKDDRKLFMNDLGIEETGLARLSKAMYEQLGLISFLTVGEDEVRAWPVRKGISVKEAGGKIHSDIERGFIRA